MTDYIGGVDYVLADFPVAPEPATVDCWYGYHGNDRGRVPSIEDVFVWDFESKWRKTEKDRWWIDWMEEGF